MKIQFIYLLRILILSMLYSSAFAETRTFFKNGYVLTPNSSIAKPGDAGLRAHTNYKIYVPYNKLADEPQGETPASLACVYGLTPAVPGCPIRNTRILPSGGQGAIALVDAYDNPSAEADLNVFSAKFGLPACTTANGCFTKIYAGGTQPDFNDDWAVEEALDVEWAHAMAPHAKIILVEATTNSNDDLFQAEDVATQAVQANGGGEVSNSWGEDEYTSETNDDAHFKANNIVYLASSGDDAAPANYPASSPFVVCAGGTSVFRRNGNFLEETAWSFDPKRNWGGSGGPSLYETRPTYQNLVQKIVGSARGTPDISFDADPRTGVSIYIASRGWIIVGGTSVSSPSLAGIINSANYRARTTAQELNYIYTNVIKNYHSYWHDTLKGNNGFPALSGYDFTTGIGSPLGYKGK